MKIILLNENDEVLVCQEILTPLNVVDQTQDRVPDVQSIAPEKTSSPVVPVASSLNVESANSLSTSSPVVQNTKNVSRVSLGGKSLFAVLASAAVSALGVLLEILIQFGVL